MRYPSRSALTQEGESRWKDQVIYRPDGFDERAGDRGKAKLFGYKRLDDGIRVDQDELLRANLRQTVSSNPRAACRTWRFLACSSAVAEGAICRHIRAVRKARRNIMHLKLFRAQPDLHRVAWAI